MKVFSSKFFLISSCALMVAACSESVGDTPREGQEPGQCEDGADNDGDGYFDCDDSDCVGAPACGGDTDDTGFYQGDEDADNDGYTVDDGDCDDGDARINPGADEKCNGKDDDCDDVVDNDPVDGTSYYEDWDSDGYGDENVEVQACEQPNGYVTNDDDCDDTSNQVKPGGNEISWNGIDEDCDGSDFNGQACMEESADDALSWVSYWAYSVADVSDTFAAGLGSYSVENQTLYFNGQNATVQGSEGSTTQFNLSLDTEIAMNSSSNPFDFAIDVAGIYGEECLGHVGWTDLDFEGSVALTVQGTNVTGNVELVPAWSGVIQNDVSLSGCNTQLLDTAISYAYGQGWIPFSDLLFFLDEMYQNTFDALAAEIAAEVEWYLEYNCAG